MRNLDMNMAPVGADLRDNTAMWADLRDNTAALIKTCRLLETRVVDAYCLALPDSGEVLCLDGIRTLPTTFGDDNVQRSRDLDKVKALRDSVKADNPDNETVQRLVVMGWKRAARLQRQRAEGFLATVEERLANLDA